MSRTPARTTLLEELDSRQNEVLSQLEDLNQKLVDLLNNCSPRTAPPDGENTYQFASE